MAFTLSPEIEESIRRKVRSGDYESAGQVIEEAMALLEERDHLQALRRDRLLEALADGVFQADNRQLVAATEVFRGLAAQAAASDE